jgi:polyisoprenoid-binding protein YceI
MTKAFFSLLFLIGILNISAQQYKPVDEKSEVKFTIKNFGLNTGGSLNGLKGIIKFDPLNVAASSFNVSVDVNTINTGIDARDSHIKKEDYFDAAKFPAISFVSTGITGNQSEYTVTGNLTIKGVTKPVSFPFTVKTENNGLTFEGSFNINRKDFGVGGSSAVLSNSVDITLKVVAVKN